MIVYKRAQKPAHRADDQRTEQGGTKTSYHQATDKPGGHQQQHGVDHKGEQPQSQNIYRQGQNQQNRPEESVQNAQSQGSKQRRAKAGDLNSVEQISGQHDGHGQNQPTQQQPAHKYSFLIIHSTSVANHGAQPPHSRNGAKCPWNESQTPLLYSYI